ncbi:PAS domain-containing sensor histidine kinase [Halorussus sp. MSC15.2]|uniref:sensor histidine kinase n=1 Tax=Halorussus sp. MSC15.2 TaxID=2283638 RepID=UPI00196851ED|nr:PAS domain-containing sensor histidine kinase [Halorussus sp. MSC15.2]
MTVNDSMLLSGLDVLPSQVAILDGTGDIVFTNRAWREFPTETGAVADDHVGTNYLEVCEASGDDEASRIADRLRALLDGDRERVSVEYFCPTPRGDRWFTMRGIEFEQSGERYVLVMHVDITDRKQSEIGLRNQNAQLETVAGLLSHDLRNPLNVALGRAELVESEHAEPLVRSLQRMESIISEALEFVRSDETAATRTVELRTRANRAWEQVETGDADLSVVDSTEFEADPQLLNHVLENCFRNAVEHGSASPRSHAHEDAVDHDESTVVVGTLDLDDGFFVADDGRGVPVEDRERVFEDGYTTASTGTGLGLAIVERIVDAHGWRVRIAESESGGARFEIRV